MRWLRYRASGGVPQDAATGADLDELDRLHREKRDRGAARADQGWPMTELFDGLMAPEVRPFLAAAGIVFALALIEVLALIGFSLSELIGKEFGEKDTDVDADDGGWFGGLIIWIIQAACRYWCSSS